MRSQDRALHYSASRGKKRTDELTSDTFAQQPGTRQILGAIRILVTLTLILIPKPYPYPNPNHNPNPTYPNKPTEPYQTVLTLTDTVGLQCAPSDRHTRQQPHVHCARAVEMR